MRKRGIAIARRRLFSRPHDHHIRTGFFLFFKDAPLKKNTVYVYGHSFDGMERVAAQPLRNSTGCAGPDRGSDLGGEGYRVRVF